MESDSDLTAEDILAACEVLRRAEREYELRVGPYDDPRDIRQAFDTLVAGTPLKSRWPDGSRVDPPHTPRQVISLTDGWGVRVTHEQKEYQEAHARICAELGRRDPRLCEGMTKDDRVCEAHAMPYIERPRCNNHATPEEREHNKKMREEERSRLDHAIRQIGMQKAME